MQKVAIMRALTDILPVIDIEQTSEFLFEATRSPFVLLVRATFMWPDLQSSVITRIEQAAKPAQIFAAFATD